MASVVPEAVDAFPFGVAMASETVAPPTGFPFWSVTRTVRYSKDFCVLTVGETVNDAIRAWLDEQGYRAVQTHLSRAGQRFVDGGGAAAAYAWNVIFEPVPIEAQRADPNKGRELT